MTTPLADVFGPAGLQHHALRYQFMPAEMMQGDPMDTAHLHDGRFINVTWRGGDRWAVEYGHGWSMQEVWCEAEGDWVLEPQPSSRTEEFKHKTRYSLVEALTIGQRLANEPDHATHTGRGSSDADE